MSEQYGFLFSVGIFLGVLFIGRLIYARNAGKANAATSVFGIFNGVVRSVIGFFLIIGGGPIGLVLGSIISLWGVLSASTHTDRLNETTNGSTLRSRLL